MGRLIDEDAVMHMLTSVELNNGTIKDAKAELRNIKTAYNVKKVVAEIGIYSGNGYRDVDGDYVPPMIRTNKATDIVKAGGVE